MRTCAALLLCLALASCASEYLVPPNLSGMSDDEANSLLQEAITSNFVGGACVSPVNRGGTLIKAAGEIRLTGTVIEFPAQKRLLTDSGFEASGTMKTGDFQVTSTTVSRYVDARLKLNLATISSLTVRPLGAERLVAGCAGYPVPANSYMLELPIAANNKFAVFVEQGKVDRLLGALRHVNSRVHIYMASGG